MMMRSISLKIENGLRIDESEALWLYQHAELNALGRLANRVNLRKNGKAVFYNINRHINPTNICALSCKFCAYSKKIGEEGGYAYEIDEMITKAGEAVAQGATELHMVGGLHPRWNFQRYVDMIAAMHKAYPHVHLKAFTAVELDWMARKSRKTIAEVMIELRNAGLGSFPGGGAEIFHAEIRDKICDTKVSGEQWIDTHRTAHNLGLRSNCTMLYGHIESYEHRVDHMRQLRELQDETYGFNVFIPLAFQPFQNEMGVNRYTFGADDLRTIAVARLYLDNFKHIKSYWVMLGQDVAQLALQFGANDLDGTVLEEKISKAAGGRAGMIMTRSNLENLIRRSDRIPVERTTLYHPVHEHDRLHLAPVHEEAIHLDAQRFLNRLEKGDSITPSDLWNIAVHSPLHAISQALDGSGKRPSTSQTLTECIELPLNDHSTPDQVRALFQSSYNDFVSKQLVDQSEILSVVLNASQCKGPISIEDFCSVIKAIAPHASICIRGIACLAPSAESQGFKLSEFFGIARHWGLDLIEEATSDRHLPLDTKWLVFSCALSAEIAVVPALTIETTSQTINWSKWADDVSELKSRTTFNELIFAVNVLIAEDTLVMPSEYMKLIALTRMTLPTSTGIWTPTHSIPALSPTRGIGADKSQHPFMKLVSTVHAFGSSSLGLVAANEFSTEHLWQDLRASGHKPKLACLRQNEVAVNEASAARFASLRHIPAVDQTLNSGRF